MVETPCLVIIDGLDGVGKDTHARLVKERYENKGERVVIRSHPESDNFFGRKTKRALFKRGRLNKIRLSIFYMFDVVRSIKLYYRKDVCDTLILVRYLMGTAYAPRGFDYLGYHLFRKLVPTSRYMFFLDAPPQVLLERIRSRKKREIFETLGSLEEARRKALKLAKDWIIIDATGSINETFNRINLLLDKLDKTI